MKTHWFQKNWTAFWTHVLVGMTHQELGWLALPNKHSALLTTRRTLILATRVQVVAGLFAVLTPLWIIVDMFIFPDDVWPMLALARILTTIAFVAVVLAAKRVDTLHKAYIARHDVRGTHFILPIHMSVLESSTAGGAASGTVQWL